MAAAPLCSPQSFVAGLPMFPLSLPVLPLPAYMAYERAIGLSRPAPPDGKSHLINPMFADQLGWKTMTQTVAGAYWSLPRGAAPDHRGLRRSLCLRRALSITYGPRYGLPTVISPNNQYYLWGTRGYSGRSMLAVGATDYWLLLHWFGSVQPDRGLSQRLPLDARGPAADLHLHPSARAARRNVARVQVLRPLGTLAHRRNAAGTGMT